MNKHREHLVLVGFGRVGHLVAEELRREERPLLIIEEHAELAETARNNGFEVISGNAAQPTLLAAANLAQARWLLVAIPNAFEAGQIVAQARIANPTIDIIARAHSDAEVEHLRQYGANEIIMGEREIARGMIAHILGHQSPVMAAAERSIDEISSYSVEGSPSAAS